MAAHGCKSPKHSHPPLVIVSLGTGRVKLTGADGKKQILDLSPGQAFWLDATEHSWELLAGEINMVAVEVKAAKGAPPAKPVTGTGAALDPKDATVADAAVHQVMFENEHARVFRALAAHGHKSPMHSHPPFVVVSLGTARLQFTLPDGKKQIADLSPGQALWLDAVQHSWELLAGDLNAVGVEPKAAKATMAAAAKPK